MSLDRPERTRMRIDFNDAFAGRSIDLQLTPSPEAPKIQ